MLAGVSWELLGAEEYKNDLEQPDFLGVPGIPHAASQSLVAATAQPDPNSPCTPKQWEKVSKMVA